MSVSRGVNGRVETAQANLHLVGKEQLCHQVEHLPVYVTGGGGTHLEPRIASHYLSALIAEAGARGLLGIVTAVKTQQSEIDAPLDDLVVEGRLPDGTTTRLDLQITTALAFTEGDDKWVDTVRRGWATFRRTGFNTATDRIGVAVSQTTTKLERSIHPLLARARHAADASQYRKRLEAKKGSSPDQRDFQRTLDTLIRAEEPAATDADILAFLKALTIIHFDLDQEEASRDRLGAIDQLAPVVGGAVEARRAWSTLVAMASRVIPSGGGVDRATVARQLQTDGFTVGSDRVHAALIEALNTESGLALSGIRDTIGGRMINRDVLYGTILNGLVEARLLRVVGQHGAGKSAVLKRLALDEPVGAPIFVLRDLRVTGGGWPAHAARFGSVKPIATVLREFGLCGSRTLFIDGADKMDPAAQVTVNDLLKTIADTPDLDGWRIVMTMREENAQRVDGWLDVDANAKLPSRTIRVQGFDEDEAVEAAEAIPSLRPLLADARNFDAVLRRPFFLDALSRLPVAGGAEVRSEVDLVELWWTHGGADAADFAPAQGRRNVLLKLGDQLSSNPGAPLVIRDIDPIALDQLLGAGVLRHVDVGSSVAFAHDIYEEWVLERVLSERRADIAQAIRDGRQDLQLARPLQLLASQLLERSDDGSDWVQLLDALTADDLRATWSRVVLAAPVRSVRSDEMLNRIGDTLLRDNGRLLTRLVLSVRTTETVRDLRFLDERQFPDLSNDMREQYASEAAQPEFVGWLRLINWLVSRLGSLPKSLDVELIPLFATWAASLPAPIARYAHVPDIATWAVGRLGDVDKSNQRERGWTRSLDSDEFRSVLLKCASGAPDIVGVYLAAISDRAMVRVRSQIAESSGSLAVALPDVTTAFIHRAYLLDHGRPPARGYSAMREHSEILGFDDQNDFYPPSPLRPPFLQLLRVAPGAGLELIRSICNHAMEGWRRSCRESGETPIPLTIDFGRGGWPFWGDESSYLWFRSGSHAHILDTALLALDAWAHERLTAGDALDDLCHLVAGGNQCNAVLGICAGLCLADPSAALASETGFAIITHPALWSWDINRQVLDIGPHPSEIAHWGGSTFLAGALHRHNRLPHRQHTVRDLSIHFAALATEEVKAAYAATIGTFLDRVPYLTAEERDDPERARLRRRSFEALSEQADPANLVEGEVDGRRYITIEPPYVESESHKAMMDQHASQNRVLRLYLWANRAIENGFPGEEIGLREAFDEMVALDEPDLFDAVAPISEMTRHKAQSAVSATAAVLARHADGSLWTQVSAQVVDVTWRASTMAEAEDGLSYRGSHVTAHPPAMAAYGYAALLRRDPDNTDWRTALFQLAVDPIDKVVEAVYDCATLFADAAPDMVWRLFCLATQRAASTVETGWGLHWSPAEAQEQSGLAEEAERIMAAGEVPIPHAAPTSRIVRGVDEIYHSHLHANGFRLPLAPMLDPATRNLLIDHVGSALDWALASSSAEGGRHDTPFEWRYAFSSWLGRLLAFLSPSEINTLVIARVDAAGQRAAAEVMETAIQSFMIDRMLRKELLNTATLESWEFLINWAIARPIWSSNPTDARRHESSMAVSALFCAIDRGVVCGIDAHWPNLDTVLPILDRAVNTFATEMTAFAAIIALLRARPDRLLPDPGLGWISHVARTRRAEPGFWSHASNGERLVLLLRDKIASRSPKLSEREIIVEVADILIELGVKGAAFLLQDLVRQKCQN
ncbi:hypothetical protein [Mesorhizobium sp. L103C131B0]|uniref:hypothetical protein n=1 Tax=Mesorhizobium sp. L103C131B0 TaxID=1287089 RepID=UPI0003D02C12|nr:hypothetical protein [Mesorhizobium sp. L103C131B0]ESZ61981.1 hypothetical protein X729_13020 [Mesorhizobium sp. L103C131B0]